MRIVLLAVSMLYLYSIGAYADSVTLTTPETLATPQATKLDWYIDLIDAREKMLVVKYRWRDATGTIIKRAALGQTWESWACRDLEVPGENVACTGAGTPTPCCTGVGTGTCDDMLDTCFTDVFGFRVRQQDVGTAIGVGLRQLIWNKFKQTILSGGNDGAFD